MRFLKNVLIMIYHLKANRCIVLEINFGLLVMLINIDKRDVITADRLAVIREYYEYRRSGKDYNYNGTPNHTIFFQSFDTELKSKSNIFFGILFEICLFNYFTVSLNNLIMQEAHYSRLPKSDRDTYSSNKMRRMGLSYEMKIGQVDDGFDFLLNQTNNKMRIDAKVYPNRIFSSQSDCKNYKLLVDERQFSRNMADCYIQGFIISQNNTLSFYVPGGALAANLQSYPNLPSPARGLRLDELSDISLLIDSIYSNA